MTRQLSRRMLLRGSGTALALPLLEAMLPAPARAAGELPRPPVRLFFYIVGGGAYVPYWAIDDAGRKAELADEKSVVYQAAPRECDEPLSELSPTLQPLARHKQDLLVLGGLTLIDTHQFEDGHSAEIAALLTAAPLHRDRVYCGPSVDQVAARHLGGKTAIDSLVLGLSGARPGGAKGIGRVYAQHYSWRTPTTPTGEERNPRAVFDRLFRDRRVSGGSITDADRRSVLDLVGEEAKTLLRDLGADDRRKLDEYLVAVRDVERRIEVAAKKPLDRDAPSLLGDPRFEPTLTVPEGAGIPETYAEYDRLMIDLVSVAFAADLTRVAVLTHGGYRSYPEVGVKRGHHDLQHHEGNPDKRADLRKVDHFNMELFAAALDRMKAVKDGGGTLLDNSLALWASGMSNGNRHARENLPLVLAGRGGGTVRPGRYLDFNWKNLTPVANLYTEMLGRAGVPVTEFGNSTAALPQLS